MAYSTNFSQEWQQQQENQYKLYQERQQKLQEEFQEACRRTQETNQEFLKACDNILEILQELAQEEERNEQLKKAEEKIQEQEQNVLLISESEGAENKQSKQAEEVKVDQAETFQKLREECDLTTQKIKNADVLVQEFVKEKSDDECPSYHAEQLFDEKLKSVPAQKEFQISVPVLVVKKLELRRNMKYLVGLRHRWRWKYDAEQLFVKKLHRKLGTSVLPLPKLPQVDLHGIVQPEPHEVLNRRSRKSNSYFVTDFLILWAGQMADDAARYGTLEKASTFLHESPGEVRSENQSPKVMRLAWGNSSHVCCLMGSSCHVHICYNRMPSGRDQRDRRGSAKVHQNYQMV